MASTGRLWIRCPTLKARLGHGKTGIGFMRRASTVIIGDRIAAIYGVHSSIRHGFAASARVYRGGDIA